MDDARTFSNALTNLTNKKIVEAIREENAVAEDEREGEESDESEHDKSPNAATD